MEDLSPPIDINVIVVIARSREADLVELRVRAHRSYGLETSTRMSVDPDTIEIYRRVEPCDLLDRGFVIGERVVSESSRTEVIEVTSSVGATTPR